MDLPLLKVPGPDLVATCAKKARCRALGAVHSQCGSALEYLAVWSLCYIPEERVPASGAAGGAFFGIEGVGMRETLPVPGRMAAA